MSESKLLYERICGQHDGIADFRAKLLALLPVASGAGLLIFLERKNIRSSSDLVAIGLFGMVATLGLFFYELRGIQKCNALIDAARELEERLDGQFRGAFRAKPPSRLGVGETKAALLVYPAVWASWVYVAASGISERSAVRALAALIGAVALATFGWLHDRKCRPADLQALLELNRESFRAEDLRNREMLDPILDQPFRITRASGEQQDRAAMLKGVAEAKGRREIRRTHVEPTGRQSAVVTSLIHYRDDSGQPAGDFWNTKVFRREGDHWRCREWQVSRLD